MQADSILLSNVTTENISKFQLSILPPPIQCCLRKLEIHEVWMKATLRIDREEGKESMLALLTSSMLEIINLCPGLVSHLQDLK